MSEWTEKLTGRGIRRGAIALYVVCLVALIVAFVSVSLLQVEHAAYIQASPTIEKGRPNAMRGVVLDAPTGQLVTKGSILVEIVNAPYHGEESLDLLEAARKREIASGQTERSGHLHLAAELPDEWKAGEYALLMHAGGEATQRFRTGRSVEVAERSISEDYWPQRTDRLPKDDRRRDDAVVESAGPIRIDLLPRDGRVSRGLETEVFLRTTVRDTGEPISTEITFEKLEGIGVEAMPATIRTDRLGLARLEVAAMTDQTWTVSTDASAHRDELGDAKPSNAKPSAEKPSAEKPSAEKPSAEKPSAEKPSDEKQADAKPSDEKQAEHVHRTKLHLTTVPTQVSLQMNDVLAVANQSVVGTVSSLFKSGGLMVDLYNGEDWVEAAAFGIRPDKSGIKVRVPALERRSPLYRVQIYKNFYDQGGAWDVEYLVAADGHALTDYQQAAQDLAEHLAKKSDDPYFEKIAESNVFSTATDEARLRTWIEAMLEAVPRHFDAPPILINSQKAARDRLDAWKEEVKADLILLTAIALLIGLAVLGYLVVLGIRSYGAQNRMLRDVELEMSLDAETGGDDDAFELDKSISEGNFVAGLQIFIVVATLVLFTLGILLLLSYL